MKLLIMFFLIIRVSLKLTDASLKQTFSDILTQKKWNKGYIDAILDYIENTDQDNDYTKFSGAGGFGAVFIAKDGDGKEWAFKFQKDDQDFRNSRKAYQEYTNIVKNHEKDKYVVKMVQPIEVKTQNNIANFGVIKMESGFSSRTVLANAFTNDQEEKANCLVLLSIVKKIIKAFSVLNYDYRYYHGDIKLDNLLYVKEDDDSTGVRIIDFDFSFKDPKLVCDEKGIKYYEDPKRYVECNPDGFMYTIGHRPPELKAIVPKNGWSADKDDFQTEVKHMKEYQWNKYFKEEAYAVGMTIKEILNIHLTNKSFKKDSSIGQLLGDIQDGLLEESIGKRWSLGQMSGEIEDRELILGIGGNRKGLSII